MTIQRLSESRNGFNLLRRLAQPPAAEEKCDFCNTGLSPNHRHLFEVSTRLIICACEPCALRFQDVVGGRFKLIPRDVRTLGDFQMTDTQWESLALPINLAFFFDSSATGKMTALYPSPAGATESLLPLDSWQELAAQNPELKEMAADVEAMLVNRVGASRGYFIVPIDLCFELVGLIRSKWRGLSGGDEVWGAIEKFFARIRQQAQPSSSGAEVIHA